MAVVTYTNAVNFYDYFLPGLFVFDALDPNLDPLVTTSATRMELTAPGAAGLSTIVATGTGFTYFVDASTGDQGAPLSGIVDTVTLSINGQLWMTISGLSVALTDLVHFMFGWEDRGQYRPGNGFDLFSLFLAGNDTINGSAADDFLADGFNTGNDLINAGGGSDFIMADAGNDTINGAGGSDMYSLSQTHWDGSAYRGANVNLATGRALDSWGGTDTLSSIERLEGSRMSDRFTGSDAWEQFRGLRGNDTINGGGGIDLVRYDWDARWGGNAAVNVNLTTGIATDGWGNTDRLVNIEDVIGTNRSDTIVGNLRDNLIIGGAGVDVINGGAGRDTADFWTPDVLNGAIVNLSLTTNQVQNDGFGNRETLVSIENLNGTSLADNLTGNRLANRISGYDGNDTINGGAGNDTLVGGRGFDQLTGGTGADVFVFDGLFVVGDAGGGSWGPVITDFRSGIDTLVSAWATDPLRFQNGTSAGTAGEAWFYFDGATNRLFWDADGIGGAAAYLVVTLTGVNQLAASDFEFWG